MSVPPPHVCVLKTSRANIWSSGSACGIGQALLLGLTSSFHVPGVHQALECAQQRCLLGQGCNALEVSAAWTSCSLEKRFLLLFVLDCAPGLAQQQASLAGGKHWFYLLCSSHSSSACLTRGLQAGGMGWSVLLQAQCPGDAALAQAGQQECTELLSQLQSFSGVTWRGDSSALSLEMLRISCVAALAGLFLRAAEARLFIPIFVFEAVHTQVCPHEHSAGCL